MDQIARKGQSMLMVSAPRPVYERLGYHQNSDQYFNAGMFVSLNLSHTSHFDLNRTIDIFFKGDPRLLTWHDQDLLNAFYGDIISPLPLGYNVSSGIFHSDLFAPSRINYLAKKELIAPIVIHASGGALFSKKHYPYREKVLNLCRVMLADTKILTHMPVEVAQFRDSLVVTKSKRQLRYFQSFAPSQRIKLIREIETEFIVFRFRNYLLATLRKLSSIRKKDS